MLTKNVLPIGNFKFRESKPLGLEMGQQVGSRARLFSVLMKIFLNLAKFLNLYKEQWGLCSVADRCSLLTLHPHGAWSAAWGALLPTPGLPCPEEAALHTVEETWGREGTSHMWLFTQALDLATIRNESRNISSCVFSVLLWWAIREQGGTGGEGEEPRSSWVSCFQINL